YYHLLFLYDPSPPLIYTPPLPDALPIFLIRRDALCHFITVHVFRKSLEIESELGGARYEKRADIVRPDPIGTPPSSDSISSDLRSEEHTSELHHDQISYAVFCLKKKKYR